MTKHISKIIAECKKEKLSKAAQKELESLAALQGEVDNLASVLDVVLRTDPNYPQKNEEFLDACENAKGARGNFYMGNRAIIEARSVLAKIKKAQK